RVLDLTDERGQFAGLILAVLGADVVAVEPPGGSAARGLAPLDPDGRSLPFLAFNRGKRSVCLDLTTAAGRASLDALAADADVVLTCAPLPGTEAGATSGAEDGGGGLAGLTGADLDALAERHPHLVVVSISPFGRTGPKADWHATDLTVW